MMFSGFGFAAESPIAYRAVLLVAMPLAIAGFVGAAFLGPGDAIAFGAIVLLLAVAIAQGTGLFLPALPFIAVVGLGAIMPDAPDAETFWANITGGRYSISDVTPDRWDPALYYDEDRKAEDKKLIKGETAMPFAAAGVELVYCGRWQRVRWRVECSE